MKGCTLCGGEGRIPHRDHDHEIVCPCQREQEPPGQSTGALIVALTNCDPGDEHPEGGFDGRGVLAHA
jgi:hypothetical protein